MSICQDCKRPMPCPCESAMEANAAHWRAHAEAYYAKCGQPLTITDDLVQRAKNIAAATPVKAAGYRIKARLIEAEKGLDAAEAQQFPTLAKAGAVLKSDNQKSREDRGSDIGIVVDIGPAAFKMDHMGGEWVKVGQIIRTLRYAGHQFEEPAGSGNRYALLNDEDILGVYEQNVLEVTNG